MKVLDDRELGLAEEFVDMEAAVDRQGRRALAGKVAGLEQLVGVQRQRFPAIFRPTLIADAVIRPRDLTPISPSAPVMSALAICSDVWPSITPKTFR